MCKLKEWTASEIEEYDDARLELAEDGQIDCTRVYIKQDVDNVIADLEESHRKEVGQLLIEITELKADYKEACDRLQTANLIKDEQLAAARHQKHKRCMAMARWCDVTALFYGNNIPKVLNKDITDSRRQKVFRRLNHYKKWYTRWLEFAKQFKE